MSVIALGAGLLAGCGEDEAAEQEAATTPAQAISEIQQVRSGLDQAVALYASGDATKADELVGDAYLEHFELVEGPLEAVDGELTEKLEDSIREELREKIQAKAPQDEVKALAGEIRSDLDKAEAALR